MSGREWLEDAIAANERRARAALLVGFAEAHVRFGVTIAGMASRLGVKPAWVKRRLMGDTQISLRDLSDLALAMGGSIEVSVVDRVPIPAPSEVEVTVEPAS